MKLLIVFFYKSLGRQIFFVLKLLAFANFTYQTIFCILAKITAKKSFSLENVFFYDGKSGVKYKLQFIFSN